MMRKSPGSPPPQGVSKSGSTLYGRRDGSALGHHLAASLSIVFGWRVMVRTLSHVRPRMLRLLGEFSTSSVMGMYTYASVGENGWVVHGLRMRVFSGLA